MVSVNLVANTDLRTAGRVSPARRQGEGRRCRSAGRGRRRRAGRRKLRLRCPIQRRNRSLHGRVGAAHRNSLDVVRSVRAAMPGIEAQVPAGMKVGIPYDSTKYIEDAINEVLRTLTETLLIVIVVIFLFLGSFRP